MRIGIFLPIFWPEQNGLINYAVGLYSNLLNQNSTVELTIITFDFYHEKILCSKEGNFLIYRIPCYVLLGGTYVIPTLKGIREFWKIAKNNQFDVINTHTRFFISSLLGLITAKKQRIPLLHTEHGSTFVKDGSLFTRIVARVYDETLGRLVISSATKLFGVSKSCIEFAHKLGGKNGSVIYNGIDASFWKTDEKITNQVPNITFCGRMVKGKGVQDLLEALAKLTSFNWRLHLIGDGNYISKLKNLAEDLKLEDRIKWYGSQNKSSIKSILEKTDIFINPSYTEGLPTSVLEAGAMRCAVIATNVGGTIEVIDDKMNGLLLPAPEGSQNIDSIINAVKTILEDPELQRKYGDAIAEKVKSNFSWSSISKVFLPFVMNKKK